MRVNMMDVSPKGTPVKQSRDVRHASLPNPLAMPHSVDDDDELAPTGNLFKLPLIMLSSISQSPKQICKCFVLPNLSSPALQETRRQGVLITKKGRKRLLLHEDNQSLHVSQHQQGNICR